MTQDELRKRVNAILNKAHKDLGLLAREVTKEEGFDLGDIVAQTAQDVDKVHHKFYDALLAYELGPS